MGTNLDEFGTDKPYKKGGKGPVADRHQTGVAPQKRRSTANANEKVGGNITSGEGQSGAREKSLRERNGRGVKRNHGAKSDYDSSEERKGDLRSPVRQFGVGVPTCRR